MVDRIGIAQKSIKADFPCSIMSHYETDKMLFIPANIE
jgi:hypothetical protein